jgi:hypothetical protein
MDALVESGHGGENPRESIEKRITAVDNAMTAT